MSQSKVQSTEKSYQRNTIKRLIIQQKWCRSLQHYSLIQRLCHWKFFSCYFACNIDSIVHIDEKHLARVFEQSSDKVCHLFSSFPWTFSIICLNAYANRSNKNVTGDVPGSEEGDPVTIQVPRQVLSRRRCWGIDPRYHVAPILSSGMEISVTHLFDDRYLMFDYYLKFCINLLYFEKNVTRLWNYIRKLVMPWKMDKSVKIAVNTELGTNW